MVMLIHLDINTGIAPEPITSIKRCDHLPSPCKTRPNVEFSKICI